MKKSRMTADRKIDIIAGLAVQILCFIPWIESGGSKYPAFLYFIRMIESGGAQNLVVKEIPEALPASAVIFQAELVMLLIIQAVGLIQFLVSLRKKNNTLLTGGILVLSVAVFYISGNTPAGQHYMGQFAYLYPITMMGVCSIWFLGTKMLAEWDEASRQEKERRAAEEEFRKERKRRLKFEGKYSKLFYRIIWKNFRYNWKEYSMFLSSTILVSGLIFSGFGIRKLLISNTVNESMLTGQGLGMILAEFLVVLFLLSVSLITFILLFYLRSQMKNMGMFLTLGIRTKTMFLYCGLELFSCFITGLLAGLAVGNFIIFIFKKAAVYFLHESVKMGTIDLSVYLFTTISVFFVFLISIVAVHDLYIDMGYQSKDGEVKKEKMPVRWKVPGVLAGMILTGFSIFHMQKRTSGEGIFSICILFAGLYFLIKNGGCIYLLWRKRRTESYLKNVAAKNIFYHRFQTSTRYMFVMTILHISALFVFMMPAASNLIEEPAEKLFPYDAVCLADEEDHEFFEGLKEEFDLDIKTLPMVRATTVDNTEQLDDYRAVVIPQGQNIGISMSSYKKLKEWNKEEAESFSLDDNGKEIYIVYQQDKGTKAHPIDWYVDGATPYVRIGQPLDSYSYIDRKELYPPRTIKGEETKSLIGSFRQGKYENLIVFSDAYFDKEFSKDPEGSSNLVLINGIKEKDHDRIMSQFLKFKEKHKEDEKYNSAVQSVYISKDEIKQRNVEKMMEVMVHLFLVIMLLVVGMFLMHTKVESDIGSYQKKYRFLELIGMPYKERIRTLKKELLPFVTFPFTMGGIFVILFTGIIFHLRQYHVEDMIQYYKYAVLFYGIYLFIHIADYQFLKNYVLKRTGIKKYTRKRVLNGCIEKKAE